MHARLKKDQTIKTLQTKTKKRLKPKERSDIGAAQSEAEFSNKTKLGLQIELHQHRS